jgi:YidC/Oxa1 family membrane protein insertase
LHLLLAASWLDPIVGVIATIVGAINTVTHSLGWSLVILAALLKLLFWPLNTKQFKTMLAMQKIAPKLKVLQERYAKKDPQRYQQETMALYKQSGANPAAGCWPLLLQYPVIISVYYAVMNHKDMYSHEGWTWIGSRMAETSPMLFGVHVLGSSLASPDLVLLVLYMISMYFFSRYGTVPSTDPQQAATQKMMAIISPVMLGFLGVKYQWPSAMVLYWFSFNVFTMLQQFYLLRRYHAPLSVLDNEHAITELSPATDGETKSAKTAAVTTNGATGAANKSLGKRRKKGAKK